jgi:hypothetical protein
MVKPTLAVVAEALAVPAAAAERNCLRSHNAWVAIVGPMATIRVATTTQAQRVHSRRMATKATPFFDNTMGGNDYWPPVHCVVDSQKTHWIFAGKSKPTT